MNDRVPVAAQANADNVFFFAREQARARLARVEAAVHQLLAMAAGTEATIGAIHDLRVSLRRFRATLDTFRKFFPAGERRRVRQAMRQVFAAAGEVRNRDITLELIRKIKGEGCALLAEKLQAERLALEQVLREKLQGWVREDFSTRWRCDLRLP